MGEVSATAPTALRNLPPFPPAAERLLKLLAREDASFADAARLLSTDAALAAEVLRLANSPLGGRYGAQTILQALSLLGVARVHSLVLTLMLARLLRGAKQNQLLRRCWRHNLAAALVARYKAPAFDVDPDQAYMTGLMHDIGRLALLASNPKEYATIPMEHRDTRAEEKARFGIDHCEAGAWLVTNWRLPQAWREVALRHHDPVVEDVPLTQLVHMACRIGGRLGFGVAADSLDESEPEVEEALADHVAVAINAIEIEYGL